ncbi:hypothetical protein [Persicirhabdus sediminis]|uniref:Uncharacterized protein n=1 Tax=Persicirhabdus sediminis TaxID=454144 RepID=A0A8J7ME13_9BACT|nr:hypothetical protein [Persicirhabdus sediminis]MBK1790114.1 hypothetical protein [Persicirhabdus sediminis]
MSKTKVEGQDVVQFDIKPVSYWVYTDGMEVRLYLNQATNYHTSYEVYRADGVSHLDDSGDLTLAPGLQAFSANGNILRQLSLTENELVLTSFPPRSAQIVIMRATAVAK